MKNLANKLRNIGLMSILTTVGCTTQGWGAGMNAVGAGLGGRTGAIYQAMGQGAVAIGNTNEIAQAVSSQDNQNYQTARNQEDSMRDVNKDGSLLLKNGTRLEGRIICENEKFVTFEDSEGIRGAYAKSGISSVETGEHLSEDTNRIRTRFGSGIFVTSNYAIDANQDGNLEYPREFVGIKKNFSKGESVTITLELSLKLSSLEGEVTNSNGAVVDSFSASDASQLSRVYNTDKKLGKNPSTPKKLEPGNYHVSWSCQGLPFYTADFSIDNK